MRRPPHIHRRLSLLGGLAHPRGPLSKTLGAAALLAMFLVGCADNSFLDLSVCVDKPAAPYVDVCIQVQSVSGPSTFEADWFGTDDRCLGNVAPTGPVGVSIESTSESRIVGVKVRYCAQALCQGLGEPADAESWFLIERPFSLGEVSKAVLPAQSMEPGRPQGPTEYLCESGTCVPKGATSPPTCGASPNPDASTPIPDASAGDGG